MKLAQILSSPVTSLVGKILDKFFRDKLSEGERARMRMEAQAMVTAELQKEEDNFREFILEYEGRARELPRFLIVIRGAVRPFLTVYLVAMLHWAIARWLGSSTISDAFLTVLKLLFFLNLVTLSFWFGDKMIQRTGLVRLLNRNARALPEEDLNA